MTNIFRPKGPARFKHQQVGLNRLIKQRGIGALLFDPGLGKTATTLDYLSVLALKSPKPVRVLVVCPLVAVDTWVNQMDLYVPDEIDYWAEALGGSMLEKAETLAARGGNRYGKPLTKHKHGAEGESPNALFYRKAIALSTRGMVPEQGPDLEQAPGIILQVVNFDVLSRRDVVGGKTMADVMVEAIKRFAPDVVVVDEMHKIKSASSNVSRLLSRVSRVVPRRIGLTGTVMPAGPLDVFAQWRFLDPNAFGYKLADGTIRQATFSGFKNKYAQLGGWMGKEVVGYCNTPDAPIWMRDGSFKPLGEVRAGDALMGWDQESTMNVKGGARRTFVESRVLNVQKRVAPNVVEVTLSSGRTIKCTADHQWLRYSNGDRGDRWATVMDEPYHRNRGFSIGLSRVVDVPGALSVEQQRSADWLAGMYDGEGSGGSISQSEEHNPDVCRRIEKELDALGVDYGVNRGPGRALTYFLKGGQQTYVDILNQWPITRRRSLEDLIQWSRSSRYKKGLEEPKRMHRTREHVVSVRELPPQEVVSMQTTTGNYVAWGLASKNCNLDEMQAVMSKLAVVARKEDALDLPPTQDVEIPVHLSPAEKKAYADMKADLATSIAKGVYATSQSMLTQMMRLRQITSGHLPDDDGQMHVIGRSKVNVIKSLVQDTLEGEKRVVIFALFTQEIEMLREALQAKGTELMVISGGTTTEERIAMRKRFGSSDPQRMVMVAQIKTMSLAVNELVTASHAIFGSMTQQRDELVQARDRLNRLGQTKPVTFWYVSAPGTVDEVIMQTHRNRTDLEAAMLKHVMEGADA